jgi:predicted MFS family arabinose efflux permease
MITRAISLYKNAYGGLSASTWWLTLVMLINRSGTMVIPFMTMYLTQHLHTSISKAGLVMSLFGAGAVVGALIGGRLTDKIGYYYVQICTLLGGGIMFIVVGQMKSYGAICITTFILALINEAFRPANSVAIAHYSSEENRTRSYSLNRLAINLGWAVGGALGGLIASYNYSLLFWVDGLTNICAAALLYFVLSPSRNEATLSNKKKEKVTGGATAYQDTRYLFFIVTIFIFASCFFQLFTTIPVFFKTEYHLSVLYIGIVMAINGLIITVFEMVTIFSLEGKRPHLHYIAFGVVLVGLSYFMLTFDIGNTALMALLSTIVLTFGEILSMPFMNSYWISRTQEYNRGQYAALFTVAWASAQAVGPYLGSLVVEHKGYNLLWYIIGAICLFLAMIYRAMHRKDITGPSS